MSPTFQKAKIPHEAADSASNTYRRLMQSFDERRKPSRQPIVTIGQTNVARQQIVQNIRSDAQKKITNELGSGAILARRYQPHCSGAPCSSGCNSSKRALERKHGAPDAC